jgi:hypothetical protein
LEALEGLRIGSPWRPYNWKHLDAFYLEAFEALIIERPLKSLPSKTNLNTF